MKYRKLKRVLLTFMLIALTAPLLAAEVNVESRFGYDNNPFRFNETLTINDSFYLYNQVELEFEPTEKITIDLAGRDISYFTADNADSQRLSARLAFESMIEACQCRLVASLNARDVDRTFVSRFTGQRFSFSGEDAGDRYDYFQLMPMLDIFYDISENQELSFKFSALDRNYEEYSSLGLSNLDYEQYRARVRWQVEPTEKQRYRLYAEYQMRNFDNRIALDLAGDQIPDSNLEYTFSEIGLQTRYKLARSNWLYINADYAERRDNAQGYFDTNTVSAYVRYFVFLAKRTSFDFNVRFIDRSYPRGEISNDLEDAEETPSARSWIYRATFKSPLGTIGNLPVNGYVGLTYQDTKADISAYTFDRIRTEIGIELSF